MAGTKEYDLRVRSEFEHLLDVYVKRANVEVRNALPTIALQYLHDRRSGKSTAMANAHNTVYATAFYQSPKFHHIALECVSLSLPLIWVPDEVEQRFLSVHKVPRSLRLYDGMIFLIRIIEVTWSGMTDDEKRDLAMWPKERAERRARQTKIVKQESAVLEAKYGDSYYQVISIQRQVYCKSLFATMMTRQFMQAIACQSEDWKVRPWVF